jgi:hypothetical protein
MKLRNVGCPSSAVWLLGYPQRYEFLMVVTLRSNRIDPNDLPSGEGDSEQDDDSLLANPQNLSCLKTPGSGVQTKVLTDSETFGLHGVPQSVTTPPGWIRLYWICRHLNGNASHSHHTGLSLKRSRQ